MKEIYFLVILFFAITFVQAQKNLYETIEANGKTMVYEEFGRMKANQDGTYSFNDAPGTKINIEVVKLASGVPIGFKTTKAGTNEKHLSITEMSDFYRVDSYPNVLSIKGKRSHDGYIMVDDILFRVKNINSDSFRIVRIFAKVKKESKSTQKKKKKGGFMSRMKNKMKVERGIKAIANTPTLKYVKSLKLREILSDYIKAMRAKQKVPKASKDKADIAKIIKARKAKNDEIRRYNDSVKATPAYARIRQNERNYQAAQKKNNVKLRNTSNRTIYVGRSGSYNPGTKVSAGGTANWDCSRSAYIQTVSSSGAYKSTTTLVYHKNSGCGSTVTIR